MPRPPRATAAAFARPDPTPRHFAVWFTAVNHVSLNFRKKRIAPLISVVEQAHLLAYNLAGLLEAVQSDHANGRRAVKVSVFGHAPQRPNLPAWFIVSGSGVRRSIWEEMTPEQRSALMKRIGCKDTAPELAVRRLAHAWGFRFRLHRRDLPGRPDLVFPRQRKVVFVHGCFWHHHDDPACRNAVIPKTRTEWWLEKLRGNAARDTRNMRALEDLGWVALVVWECEVRSGAFVERLRSFLDTAQDDVRQPPALQPKSSPSRSA